MAGSKKVHGLLYEKRSMDTSYILNVPSPTERGELSVLTDINTYILKHGSPVNIRVGSLSFTDIYGANKMEGTPKADIALVTLNKVTKKFENVCFISHKMGQGAGSFQQYSGITWKADGNKSGSISRDKNVVAFLKKVSVLHENVVKDKMRYFTTIKDKTLVGKAVYGPNFGESKFGLDNIHFIGQGDAILSSSGKFHTLKFNSGMEFNNNITHFIRGDYTSILGIRYTDGRNYEVGGKTYSGARVLIMPRKVLGGNGIELK